MQDIGRLKDRLEKVESLTALSLLERDAESFEIQDAKTDLIVLSLDLLLIILVDIELVMLVMQIIKLQSTNKIMNSRPKCVLRNATLTEE